MFIIRSYWHIRGYSGCCPTVLSYFELFLPQGAAEVEQLKELISDGSEDVKELNTVINTLQLEKDQLKEQIEQISSEVSPLYKFGKSDHT